MNLGQMLIVILAVILFSTLIISIYNNLMTQIEMASHKVFYTQGIQVAYSIFQRLESEQIGELRTFTSLYTEFMNPVTLPPIDIGDATFTVTVRSEYSDMLGAGQGATVSDHIKVFCLIDINYGAPENLFIGNDDDSFNKVFSRLFEED
jgi:hypothetical protein